MDSVVEWPWEKVLDLIALFKQRPVLWDTKCDAYKDRQIRHVAMLELAARFNVEKDEIERKLKNLQSHFYREVKKETLSRLSVMSVGSGIYRSKWFAYNAMKFLAEKGKSRREHIATNCKITTTRLGAARVSMRLCDKSRFKKSEHRVKKSSLQSASVIKNENTTSTVNNVASSDFLYVDTSQQNNLDNNQIDYWDEKPVSIDNPDPIEFAMQVNGEAHQQSQRIANFEDGRLNEKGRSSTPCKQNAKVISEDVIAPTIDFLLAEVKANGSNDPELNFYRSLIPDIMKLSDKKRRQFKEVVLCTLNKLLDEDENIDATKT